MTDETKRRADYGSVRGPKIRSIYPTFWDDAQLIASGPEGRLFFLACISFADDHGRFEDDGRGLWAYAYADVPRVTKQRVGAWLEALDAMGKVIRYEVGHQRCVGIPQFESYQKPQKKRDSKYDPPPEDLVTLAADRRSQKLVIPISSIGSLQLRDRYESYTVALPIRSRGGEGKGGEGEVEGGHGLVVASSEATTTAEKTGGARDVDNEKTAYEQNYPDDWVRLGRRDVPHGQKVRNAIGLYEARLPNGKSVTPEEAEAFRIACSNARSGTPHLQAIEEFLADSRPHIRAEFERVGIMYAGKPLGQGRFGRKGARQKRLSASARPADERRGI